jgi:hypothetical protein
VALGAQTGPNPLRREYAWVVLAPGLDAEVTNDEEKERTQRNAPRRNVRALQLFTKCPGGVRKMYVGLLEALFPRVPMEGQYLLIELIRNPV